MKKKYFIGLLVGVLFLTGCSLFDSKKEENGENKPAENITGGWETMIADKQAGMTNEEVEIFEAARKNYSDLELEAIAVLGKQVVAGTNYMYLAKGHKQGESSTYKIVVVYHDLENKSSVKSVTDFDYTKYTNVDKSYNGEQVSGGWSTTLPAKYNILDDKVQAIFNDATSKQVGITYLPIALVGTQLVSGTNYAILCYGTYSDQNATTAIYLVTIYADLENNNEIISSANIDLAQYNK